MVVVVVVVVWWGVVTLIPLTGDAWILMIRVPINRQWGLFHGGSFAEISALLFAYSAASTSFLCFVSSFFRSAHFAAQLTSLGLVLSILVFVAGRSPSAPRPRAPPSSTESCGFFPLTRRKS